MNKHKRNLDSLRQHLGRDKDGLALLDAVARDITALRKRVAALEESEASAVANADSYRVERNQAEAQLGAIKAELGAQKNRRACAEAAIKRQLQAISDLRGDCFPDFDLSSAVGQRECALQTAYVYQQTSQTFPTLPEPTKQVDKTVVFVVEKVAKNFGPAGLLKIGLLATYAALRGFTPQFETRVNLHEMRRRIGVEGERDAGRFYDSATHNILTRSRDELVPKNMKTVILD